MEKIKIIPTFIFGVISVISSVGIYSISKDKKRYELSKVNSTIVKTYIEDSSYLCDCNSGECLPCYQFQGKIETIFRYKDKTFKGNLTKKIPLIINHYGEAETWIKRKYPVGNNIECFYKKGYLYWDEEDYSNKYSSNGYIYVMIISLVIGLIGIALIIFSLINLCYCFRNNHLDHEDNIYHDIV